MWYSNYFPPRQTSAPIVPNYFPPAVVSNYLPSQQPPEVFVHNFPPPSQPPPATAAVEINYLSSSQPPPLAFESNYLNASIKNPLPHAERLNYATNSWSFGSNSTNLIPYNYYDSTKGSDTDNGNSAPQQSLSSIENRNESTISKAIDDEYEKFILRCKSMNGIKSTSKRSRKCTQSRSRSRSEGEKNSSSFSSDCDSVSGNQISSKFKRKRRSKERTNVRKSASQDASSSTRDNLILMNSRKDENSRSRSRSVHRRSRSLSSTGSGLAVSDFKSSKSLKQHKKSKKVKVKGASSHSLDRPAVTKEEALECLRLLHEREFCEYRKKPKTHPLYMIERRKWDNHMNAKGFDLYHKAVEREWTTYFSVILEQNCNEIWTEKKEKFLKKFCFPIQDDESRGELQVSNSSTVKHSKQEFFKEKHPEDRRIESQENNILHKVLPRISDEAKTRKDRISDKGKAKEKTTKVKKEPKSEKKCTRSAERIMEGREKKSGERSRVSREKKLEERRTRRSEERKLERTHGGRARRSEGKEAERTEDRRAGGKEAERTEDRRAKRAQGKQIRRSEVRKAGRTQEGRARRSDGSEVVRTEEERKVERTQEKRTRRSEERRTGRSEERRTRRSEERKVEKTQEKRIRRSEEGGTRGSEERRTRKSEERKADRRQERKTEWREEGRTRRSTELREKISMESREHNKNETHKSKKERDASQSQRKEGETIKSPMEEKFSKARDVHSYRKEVEKTENKANRKNISTKKENLIEKDTFTVNRKSDSSSMGKKSSSKSEKNISESTKSGVSANYSSKSSSRLSKNDLGSSKELSESVGNISDSVKSLKSIKERLGPRVSHNDINETIEKPSIKDRLYCPWKTEKESVSEHMNESTCQKTKTHKSQEHRPENASQSLSPFFSEVESIVISTSIALHENPRKFFAKKKTSGNVNQDKQLLHGTDLKLKVPSMIELVEDSKLLGKSFSNESASTNTISKRDKIILPTSPLKIKLPSFDTAKIHENKSTNEINRELTDELTNYSPHINLFFVLNQMREKFGAISEPLFLLHSMMLKSHNEGKNVLECIDSDVESLLDLVKDKLRNLISVKDVSVIQQAIYLETLTNLDSFLNDVKEFREKSQPKGIVDQVDIKLIAKAVEGKDCHSTIGFIKEILMYRHINYNKEDIMSVYMDVKKYQVFLESKKGDADSQPFVNPTLSVAKTLELQHKKTEVRKKECNITKTKMKQPHEEEKIVLIKKPSQDRKISSNLKLREVNLPVSDLHMINSKYKQLFPSTCEDLSCLKNNNAKVKESLASQGLSVTTSKSVPKSFSNQQKSTTNVNKLTSLKNSHPTSSTSQHSPPQKGKCFSMKISKNLVPVTHVNVFSDKINDNSVDKINDDSVSKIKIRHIGELISMSLPNKMEIYSNFHNFDIITQSVLNKYVGYLKVTDPPMCSLLTKCFRKRK